MRKLGLGGAGLGWPGLGWAGLGRRHEPRQAPCSCDQRGETGLPICSHFPKQIIPNSRTDRGLPEEGPSQGSSTSQPKLRGRDLASWVSPDPQPRGDQGWQRASPKVHIQITNNCRALGKWPALPVP